MRIDYLDRLDQHVGFYCEEGKYLVTAAFDPINGKRIKSGLYSYFVGVSCLEFNHQERGHKRIIRNRVQQHIKEWRASHSSNTFCPKLYDLILGDDAELTRATYLPMIRACIIYHKNNTELFDIMRYCPFCRAKLPQTLEKELTEILKNEYGLNLWRDYKNAPTEFHSDEWWRKRGL